MHVFSHTIARVAVWNLAGFETISDECVERQIEGLSLLDAELVTLVEVKPFSHMQRLADGLSALGSPYQWKMIQQPVGNLNIGFLYKPAVELGDPELIAGSNGTYANGRLAIKTEVKIGKFKAVLIGVHLKSGRGKGPQATRDTQCAAISAHIDAIRATPGFTQRTILLMGDFNMIPGQDVSNFHALGGDDVMDFVSCWDLQDRFSHILDKGRANLLDGFAVSRTFSTDYVRGSLRLFPMHWTLDMGREKYKEEVSDHLPFVACFRIY
jgi:hypothetical protein